MRLHPGIFFALLAAISFGVGTPVAKLLLGYATPWMLAGLLYLGSGVGLFLLRAFRKPAPLNLRRDDMGWLAGAIVAGGIVGPVLLMWGLAGMPASGASLLLNAEAVFSALLAWFVFRENFDRRIAAGMAFIVAGAVVLSWPESLAMGDLLPALAVLGACLAWGIDNNLTRKVSLADATSIAMLKGLVAGAVNLALALGTGSSLPDPGVIAAACALGLISYGASLVLFVRALRELGTARTSAYFSIAPFCGALLALMLGEPVTLPLAAGGVLMAIGIWLHLTERHEHLHTHERMVHQHEHAHDSHHQHEHDFAWDGREPHSHAHRHEPVSHAHPHFPDMHHRDHRH